MLTNWSFNKKLGLLYCFTKLGLGKEKGRFIGRIGKEKGREECLRGALSRFIGRLGKRGVL